MPQIAMLKRISRSITLYEGLEKVSRHFNYGLLRTGHTCLMKRSMSSSKSPWDEANGMVQSLEEMSLATDYRRRGKMAEALPLLKRALEITAALGQQTNMYHLTVRRRFADTLADMGDYQKAAEEYQGVVQGLADLDLLVHSVPVHLAKAKSQLSMGRSTDAAKTSEDAIEISENQTGSDTDTDLISESYKHLGVALLFGKNEDEAIQHFQMSSRLATSLPSQAHGLSLMAAGYVQKSEEDSKAMEEATEVWKEALEMLKENNELREQEKNKAALMEAWILCHLSESEIKDRKYEESNEHLQKALKLQERVLQNDDLQLLRTLALLGETNHRLGNGVTSEGLLISSIDSLEIQSPVIKNTPFYKFLKSQVFQSYSSLLLDWDKRQDTGVNYQRKAEDILKRMDFNLPSPMLSYPMIHLF